MRLSRFAVTLAVFIAANVTVACGPSRRSQPNNKNDPPRLLPEAEREKFITQGWDFKVPVSEAACKKVLGKPLNVESSQGDQQRDGTTRTIHRLHYVGLDIYYLADEAVEPLSDALLAVVISSEDYAVPHGLGVGTSVGRIAAVLGPKTGADSESMYYTSQSPPTALTFSPVTGPIQYIVWHRLPPVLVPAVQPLSEVEQAVPVKPDEGVSVIVRPDSNPVSAGEIKKQDNAAEVKSPEQPITIPSISPASGGSGLNNGDSLSGRTQSKARSAVPSFDCAKAPAVIEKLICSDDDLSRADFQMAIAYNNALKSAPQDAGRLKANQIAWLRSKVLVCADRECLIAAYKERMSFFAAYMGEPLVK